MENFLNPYRPPNELERGEMSVTDRMHALEAEFKSRFSQMGLDMIVAAQLSVLSAKCTWMASNDAVASACAASLPALWIAIESINDLIHKTAQFPIRMHELRTAISLEWRKNS